MKETQITIIDNQLPKNYLQWKTEIETLIEQSKVRAIMNVNAELLSLYWKIGADILAKQKEQGWGKSVIPLLANDLLKRFPEDKGFSERNLKYMSSFAKNYPDFPIVQVPLAQFKELPISNEQIEQLKSNNSQNIEVNLRQITWYHHISLMAKVKDSATRAFYILETAHNGWSRDVMLSKIANNYINSIGKSINNFSKTLPNPQSDLVKYAFKDPYCFNFLGTVALQNEKDIENRLTHKMTDFLLELGKGFAFVGRQYHITVDNDDYYIDLLMYHTKLHCYVVVELKAVEFIPEFVSKLNFYISAVDEYVKTPEDKPTVGLLLCRNKSNKKAEFSLRGITQPIGISQYETEQLFKEVASALPQIEEIEATYD